MALSNLAPSAMVRHNLTSDGQNYEIWSRSIETYLMANDLWDAIELEPERFEDYKTWQKKNAMALCIICTACDEELSNLLISSKWNAKEIWDHLRAAFGQSAPAPAPAPSSAPAPAQEETSTSLEQRGLPLPKDIADLQKAVDTGRWSEVKNVLARSRELLRVGISHGKKTVLHRAVTEGREEIVRDLLTLEAMTDDVLEAVDVDGYTALAFAARDGFLSVAKLLVAKNPKLVHVATDKVELPVVLASASGHHELTRYLYTQTDFRFLDGQGYARTKKKFIPSQRNGVALLTNCIAAKIYDVAISLLGLSPSLATSSARVIQIIDDLSTAFLRRDDLVFWERWIYLRISVELPPLPQPAGTYIESQPDDIRSQPDQPGQHDDIESQTTKESYVPSHFRNNFWCVERMKKQKQRSFQALKLLEVICRQMTNNEGTRKMLFFAIENGLTPSIVAVNFYNPDMLRCSDEDGRNPLSFAVLQRQEKIFNLLYEKGATLLVGYKDKFGNNMLHHAAMLAPPLQLRKQSGAALQFQRELRWFLAVEKIVDPKCIKGRNNEGKTPRELFTIQHDDLRKEGERLMKDTASSSMTAATLIATMTFTAAFTVPGGNDQNTGFAMFLEDSTPMVTPFMIFIIADTLSLVSSTISVLSFLGILTTSYAEEHFLKSLPRKMIFGLATLFLSMTMMMVAFCATLYIILHKRINWVTYPIALCGGIPVLLFLLFQSRMLRAMIKSTYHCGILNEKKILN